MPFPPHCNLQTHRLLQPSDRDIQDKPRPQMGRRRADSAAAICWIARQKGHRRNMFTPKDKGRAARRIRVFRSAGIAILRPFPDAAVKVGDTFW
jgi:hypothetical protein